MRVHLRGIRNVLEEHSGVLGASEHMQPQQCSPVSHDPAARLPINRAEPAPPLPEPIPGPEPEPPAPDRAALLLRLGELPRSIVERTIVVGGLARLRRPSGAGRF